MQVNDYKRVGNPDAAPGGRRRSSNNSGVRPGGSSSSTASRTVSSKPIDVNSNNSSLGGN